MTFCVVLQERGIQERLLDNFESQYMSFSLKLQIAAALHQTTRLQVRLVKTDACDIEAKDYGS